MNVVHCNDCGETIEVYKVEIKAIRQVPVEGNGKAMLATSDRKEGEGDLCAKCLQVMLDNIDPNTGYGLSLIERAHV